MGTNYYLRKNTCEHCGRGDEDLHIGKSSGGWCFSLCVHPYENINTLEDWRREWDHMESDTRIVNEYNEIFTPDQMLKVITERRRDIDWGDDSWFGYKDEADFHRHNYSERGPNNLLRSRVDGHHCVGHGEGTWDYIQGEFS